MTSEPQRCGAMFSISSNPFTDAPEIPCNLPIEGFGPCVVCDDLESFRAHYMDCPGCGRAPHHPYQPSEYRHVQRMEPGMNAIRATVIDHAATPVRETV